MSSDGGMVSHASLWWRVCSPETKTGVLIVDSGLLNTSLSSLGLVLIYRRLKLLEELVNVL